MDESAVVCYSHNKKSLNNLFYELDDFFGKTVNQTGFINKVSFINSIEVAVSNIQLIIAEIEDSDIETIQFLNTINEIVPTAVKLIIGNSDDLLNIQLGTDDSSTFHYLKSPWDKSDLLLALNSATGFYSLVNTFLNKSSKKTSVSKEIEKEVSQRFGALIEANHAKDRYISIIAHDLKTPFLGLLGISDILLKDWNDLSDESKIDLLYDIRSASEETYKLLEDLLGWAREHREKLEATINEIKIHNIVDTSIKISANSANIKGIKFQNNINNKLKVNADEKMIATVFRNLISNAVKFTNPGGNIKITAKEEKNYCTFCVADDGSGIDKNDILEMFNFNGLNGFGRTRKSRHSQNQNKGLGLILCKDFVERNGGKIWLETREGEGSKFYFTVPC